MESKSLHRTRRGVSLVWACVCMTGFIGVTSLAVDFGRVQVAKAELQSTCDAAARFGFTRFLSTNGNIPQTIAAAQDAADDNRFDAGHASLAGSGSNSTEITFINWDSTTRNFSTLSGSGRSGANGLRVAASRQVPLVWASILGRSTTTIRAEAIVARRDASGATGPSARSGIFDVHGEASPWYAGAASSNTPYGAYGDTPNHNRPVEVNLPGGIRGGQSFSFTNTSGFTWPSEWIGFETDPDEVPSWMRFPAEGATWWLGYNGELGGVGGANGVPIHGLVGVFLDASDPAQSSAPSALNFAGSNRNYTTLSPGLKQPFFIGNGMTDAGVTQVVRAPAGATRLYLGILDAHGLFRYNAGSIRVTVSEVDSPLVQVR